MFTNTFSNTLNKTLSRIFQSGYSRIPVYERDQNDVIGVIRAKDLIFVKPEVSMVSLYQVYCTTLLECLLSSICHLPDHIHSLSEIAANSWEFHFILSVCMRTLFEYATSH